MHIYIHTYISSAVVRVRELSVYTICAHECAQIAVACKQIPQKTYSNSLVQNKKDPSHMYSFCSYSNV